MEKPQAPHLKSDLPGAPGRGVNQATIQVKFTYADGQGTVTFPDANGGDVVIASQPAGQSARITFTLTTDSTSGASLSGISFSPSPPHGLFEPHRQGADLIVLDNNHLPVGADPQEYKYTIQVNYNGAPFLGDPKIQNDPSSGPFKG